jgi:hypothetical protein
MDCPRILEIFIGDYWSWASFSFAFVASGLLG